MSEIPRYVTESDPDKFLEWYLNKYKTLYYRNKVIEIMKLIPDMKGKKVLDVGCCAGYMSVLFARMGAEVTGIDTSENAIKAAKLYANQKGVRCRFMNKEAWEVDESFNVILSKDVIEHILHDNGFVSNIADKLMPGGQLIIQTQNKFSLQFIIEYPVRLVMGDKSWKGWDPTHKKFYTQKSLRCLMSHNLLADFRHSSSHILPYLMITKGLFGFEPKNKWPWKILTDRKSTRLNSSHTDISRMPSSA